MDLLVESLTLDATPVPRKVARLQLCSDILHNASASVPNAWVYRSVMQARLPRVFDHLGEIHRSFPGRIKAEQFRVQISNVSAKSGSQSGEEVHSRSADIASNSIHLQIIEAWDEWCCFTPDVTEDFKRRLAGDHLAAAAAGTPPTGVAFFTGTMAQPGPTLASAPTPEPPATLAPAPGGFRAAFRSGFAPVGLNATAEPVMQVDEADVDGEIFGGGDGEDDDVDGEGIEADVDGVEVCGEGDEAATEAGEEVDVDGEAMECESETDADIFG